MRRYADIVLLTAALITAVIFAGCEGERGLPDYVGRASDNSMQIDVAKASDGSAHVDEGNMNIIYNRGDYELVFSLGASAPLTAGIGLHTSLTNPPLRISPVLTPGDDVADFFTAVRIEEETDELYVTIFIDTDWQEVVTGEIFLHTQEAVLLPDSKLQRKVETVDFSRSVDGVYMHELRFAAEDNFGDYDTSPGIWVTNVSGEPEDFLHMISTLEGLTMDHVIIYISPEVVEQ